MVKEEVKTENVQKEQPNKLTYEQLRMIATKLEQQRDTLVQRVQELEKQLGMYQMQDYYQRISLLWDIIKTHITNSPNAYFGGKFLNKVREEFVELVYPKEPAGTEEHHKEN